MGKGLGVEYQLSIRQHLIRATELIDSISSC
jgi:hypothetical protein